MNEEKDKQKTNAAEESTSSFAKKQPLRHPLAEVVLDQDHLKINKQLYQIVLNKNDALDPEMLRQKYDPYLDQYDYLVGDISSDHLRLKGFYKDVARTAIDRKEKAIADYLMEYCNPGAPYFVLKLLSPVHHYKNKNRESFHRRFQQKRFKNKAFHQHYRNNFQRRRVHKGQRLTRKTKASTKGDSQTHAFVIKKKREKE